MFSDFLLPILKQKLPPTGRLKFFSSIWEKITGDPWVLQVVQGYQIEFVKPPVQTSPARLPALSPAVGAVLDQEVQALLEKQAVHPVDHNLPTEGFISSMFVVPKKDGGNCPVVNLKPLNQYLVYEHFKMEGIHMLRDLLQQGEFLVKIDLKDAYLTVPIWKNHQKYLRFLWRENMLEFACLPFGLATAPRVFTKLMKPVVALLRGIRLIIYLDDILIMAESQDLVLHHAASVLNLLESLGFLVNYKKSLLVPSQQIEFLGLLIDSKALTLQLPGEKLRKIRKNCQKLLGLQEVSIRELSKFLGLLTSSIQAIFPAPLHFRHLQHLKNQAMSSQRSYEAMTLLDQASREEIIWWRDHLQAWNGRALFQKPVDLIIETDASRKGWGAYCQGISTGGPWCLEEKRFHINCLELLAGSLAIKTFTKGKMCAHVKLLMDNAAAVAYINKMGGTHSQVLSNLALDLWEWCIRNKMEVSAQHLPGCLNVRADRESRHLLDSSDWKLDPAMFQLLVGKWGPLEIDLFASRLTYQLPQFVSWRPDPLAVHADAFSINWKNIQGYAFPPFALIGRCLQQVINQEGDKLVLVAPVWPAQPWYPVLLRLCTDFPLLFPMSPTLLMRDNQPHPLTNLQLAGWKLSATVMKQRRFQSQLETYCWQPGERTPPPLIHQLGINGLAGVSNGKSIPFQLA
jgi:hypothetical protein